MSEDPEIKAMNDVYQTLSKLEDDEVKLRVINWVIDRFSLTPVRSQLLGSGEREVKGAESDYSDIASFNSVADIFSQASPTKDRDKVLVAAAFLQEKFGKAEITGAEINTELHNLGHGVTNVTDAISQCIERKPSLIIQTRKEGKTKQARKKYKVTTAGIKAVKVLLHPREYES